MYRGDHRGGQVADVRTGSREELPATQLAWSTDSQPLAATRLCSHRVTRLGIRRRHERAYTCGGGMTFVAYRPDWIAYGGKAWDWSDLTP